MVSIKQLDLLRAPIKSTTRERERMNTAERGRCPTDRLLLFRLFPVDVSVHGISYFIVLELEIQRNCFSIPVLQILPSQVPEISEP